MKIISGIILTNYAKDYNKLDTRKDLLICYYNMYD